MVEEEAEEAIAERSRNSAFFPSDPPYLSLAWKEYCDAMRKDKARAAAKKKKKVEVSWETQLALQAYWDAVAAAAEAGHAAFKKLDVHSGRPLVI